MAVQGTWGVGGLKIPDYGFTELFSKPGNQAFYNPNTYKVPAPSKQVKGVSTQNTRTPTSYAGASSQISASSSGGGGGSYVPPQNTGNNGGGGGGTDYGAYQSEQEGLLNQQIDQSYNPAFSALDRMEQDYRAQFPTAQAQIEQDAASTQTEYGNLQNTQLQGLNEQRQKGKVENESQIAKARRLANELRQSNLTRFGGASSTGEASGELLNRTTAEQFGDINKNFGDFNMNLDKEEKNTNDYFAKKKLDLEQETQLKKRTLQDKFDAEIRRINGSRADLESQKAAKRLGALQELSASIQQMKQEANQLTQELDLWKQYKDEAINTARQFNAKSFTVPGFKNIFDSYSVTGQSGGGSGGGGLTLDDITGYADQLGDGYEIGGINLGKTGITGASIKPTEQDELQSYLNALTQ